MVLEGVAFCNLAPPAIFFCPLAELASTKTRTKTVARAHSWFRILDVCFNSQELLISVSKLLTRFRLVSDWSTPSRRKSWSERDLLKVWAPRWAHSIKTTHLRNWGLLARGWNSWELAMPRQTVTQSHRFLVAWNQASSEVALSDYDVVLRKQQAKDPCNRKNISLFA